MVLLARGQTGTCLCAFSSSPTSTPTWRLLKRFFRLQTGQWDQLWFLGDLVGYGPNPNECVALLREFDHVSLSGNHDWAALDKLDIEEFNEDARAVVLWTRSVLSRRVARLSGRAAAQACPGRVYDGPCQSAPSGVGICRRLRNGRRQFRPL